MHTPPCGPLADACRLEDEYDRELGNSLTFDGQNPRSAMNHDFDCLCIASEHAGIENSAAMANFDAVPETGLSFQQEPLLQKALVKSQTKRAAVLSA